MVRLTKGDFIMQKSYEAYKIDVGLCPTSLATTNATGAYHSLAEYRNMIAILEIGAMVAAGSVKLEVYQGKDAVGTSGKLITGATHTIAANVAVQSMTVALATVLNTQTITINGLVFTAHTDTTVLADRQFSIAGSDTADAALLAANINDETYGVPGVTAAASTGTITLTATDKSITVTTGVGTFTLATLRACAYVEVEGLTLEDDFTHIACKITTASATVICGATLLRGGNRKAITQTGGGASV